MAYKNTEGNSSIAQQMGTWRYFNSSLEKLGTYKPATISVNPKVSAPKEQVDWATAALGVAKGAMGLFEARKQMSYKKADDYLKIHSIAEYQKAMAQGNIPFQDDPLAMQRLRYDHGKLVSQLVQQEFKAKVDSGQFIGLQPEQLDAKYFQFFREQTKNVHQTFGYQEDDYWFREGMYESTPKARIDANLKNMAATNKWQTDKGFVIDTSKFNAIVGSSQTTPQQIVDVFIDITSNPKYPHYSPKQQVELMLSGLKSISARSDAPEILDALSQNYVPIAGTYVSLKDLVGQTGWKTLEIEANNSAWKYKATAFTSDRQNINRLADNGDYRTLSVMLQGQLSSNNNNYTDRVKYLQSARQRAINRAQIIQRQTQAKVDAEQKARLKKSTSRMFISGLLSGQVVNDYKLVDISTTDIYRQYVSMIQSGELSIEQQMQIASNHTGGYNPARDMFQQTAQAALRDFDGMVSSMANNPKQAIRELPKNLQGVVTLYQKFGNTTFDNAFSNMSAHDKQIIRLLSDLNSTGGTYTQVIRSCAQIRQKSKTQEGRDELARLRDKVIAQLDIPSATGSFFDVDVDVSSGYAKDTLYGMATAYMRAGYNVTESVDNARKKFSQGHVGILDVAVPLTFFAIPNTEYTDVAEYAQGILQSKMKQIQGAQAYYDPRTMRLCITDIDNRLKYSMTTDQLNKEYKNHVLEKAKETPTSIYNRIVDFWMPK